MSEELHQHLVEHLVNHAVRTDGPFTLASGEVSDFYIDARQTTFDGYGAILVGESVLAALDSKVTAVGGMTMGADPIAVSTAMAAARARRPIQSFSVRKETKDHGTGGRIVGPVANGDVAAVVEDTTTTGATMAEAASVLAEAGIEVVQAIAIVDRSEGKAGARLADHGIPFTSLIALEELGL